MIGDVEHLGDESPSGDCNVEVPAGEKWTEDARWAFKQRGGDYITRTLSDSIFSATYQPYGATSATASPAAKKMPNSLWRTSSFQSPPPLRRHASAESCLLRSDTATSAGSGAPQSTHHVACSDCQKGHRTRQIALRGVIGGPGTKYSPHPLEAFAEHSIVYDLGQPGGVRGEEETLPFRVALERVAEELASF